ncbi:PAS domain-containing sensor histidine kinase [Pelagibius marinus]|uniref:PAS domain-containing sensor histidine kinase n=1 Tax=Pelagibius marinus TaxID=2762760 RepID=UPI0018722B65|nr:ATP-binding protein [Pelagibius marinus]
MNDLRAECRALRKQLDAAGDGAIFAEALEAVSEAIVIYDAEGRLVTCNHNFRELYGYSEEEARPGVHFAELGKIDVARGHVVVGDEYGDGDAYLERKAEYRRSLEGSFIVQLKDGRWLKTTDRRMSGGGFVSVQVDITEIKHKEEVFRNAMEQAEAAARSKSEFLANISHDLRTPLNAILGFSEMVLGEVSGPFENETYRGYLENIHKGGRLLLSIVDDILDTAKLDSGKYNLKPERFDPIELTEEVLATFTPISRDKDLQISVTAPPEGMPTIVSDRRALIQIMNNLVSNACKHTDDGGSIDLRWGLSEGKYVQFSVTDNGVGMPAELVAKIGEPFLSDGSATALRGERGTGLGFYICTKLVDLLGGVLSVDSTPGEGTSVSVQWPLESLAPEPMT